MILFPVVFLMSNCSGKKLSKEEALSLIRQDGQYPKAVNYDIYCADPKFAKKVLDAGLEEEGLLTVQRTQKLRDAGKPIIHFTSKANPYLLATPENDQSINIQKVKLADEAFEEITGIKTSNDGKSAVVEYTTAYKNITPFANLVNRDLSKKQTHKAYFSLYDDGWRYEKKPGIEFTGLEE